MKANENKGFAKTLGILLCVMAAVVYIGLLIVSADVRGYKKLLDTYCTAVQRGDETELRLVLMDAEQADVDAILTDISGDKEAAYGEDAYKRPMLRYRIDRSKKLTDSAYALEVTFTLSTKEETYQPRRSLTVEKIEGKWLISP